MKKLFARVAAGLVALGVLFAASACGQADSQEQQVQVPPKKDVIVGYVSVGPITSWRTAHEKDVQTAFKNADMDMVYMPSSKHSEQVASFNKFVHDKVNAILLTPAQAKGWSASLKKAKQAKIPVFLLDSGVDPDDSSLYTSKIGPSNMWAGQQAANYINTTFPNGAKGFMLQGPTASSLTQQRTEGWDKALSSNIAVVDSAVGDWSVETAVKQTTQLLEKFKGDDIKFIFAQNDEMGIGAADAVKAAANAQSKDSASGNSDGGSSDTSGTSGSSDNNDSSAQGSQGSGSASSGTSAAPNSTSAPAGTTDYSSIKIVTIDATKPALRNLISGKFASVIEYNPLFGEQVADLVQKSLDSKKVSKAVTVKSQVFTPESAKEELNTRKY